MSDEQTPEQQEAKSYDPQPKAEDAKIAYTYDAKKNDEQHPRSVVGVPLADITVEQANRYPPRTHAAIEASGLYTKKPSYTAPQAKPVEAEPAVTEAEPKKRTTKKADE